MKKRQFWGMAVAVCVALALALAGCDGTGSPVTNGNGQEAIEVDRTRTVKMRDGDLVFNINYTVKDGAETPASVLALIERFNIMDNSATGSVINAVNDLRIRAPGALTVNVVGGDAVFSWNAPNFEMGIDSIVPLNAPMVTAFNNASIYFDSRLAAATDL